MKPRLYFQIIPIVLVFAVSILILNNGKVYAEESFQNQDISYAQGELIIKYRVAPAKIEKKSNGQITTGVKSLDALNSKHNVQSIEKLLSKEEVLAGKKGKLANFKNHGLDRIYLVKVPKNSDIAKILKDYQSDPNVQYVEPNYIVTIDQIFTTTSTSTTTTSISTSTTTTSISTSTTTTSISTSTTTTSISTSTTTTSISTSSVTTTINPNQVIPNDPSFSLLWGLHNTGQSGGLPDADIDAVEAWKITKENTGIIIGVIDTGVDYNHIDLSSNIWNNPGEIPNNLVDDDGNGYIDDYYGWDCRNEDNNPMDDHSHGTHVAGTIAAIGNNGIGVTGVAWKAKLMSLKFLGSSGSGFTADAVQCLLYATMMDAKITSNSWGGGGYSQALYDAIAATNDNGYLFIAAAGNDNKNVDISPHYPSSYNLPNVVSVSSTTSTDQRSSFSNYGSSVDIAAPGSNIYSTLPNNGYGYKSGTSMATPHVSGVLALLYSKYPGIAMQEAIFVIKDSADIITTDKPIGGRLNALNALSPPMSLLWNDGPYRIKGYLQIKSQISTGGSWQDIGASVDDIASNNERVIDIADYLNLRQLYNNLNFIPTSQGHYRVIARFTDQYDNLLKMNNNVLMEASTEFDVTTSTSTTSTSTTSTATSTTSVLPTKQYARPDSDIDNSGSWAWPPLYAKIGDTALPYDDDFIERYTNLDNQSYFTSRVGLSNVADPNNDTGHSVNVRFRRAANSTQQLEFRIRLLQGNTQIISFTWPVTSTSFRTHGYFLNAIEASRITDYNDLSLEFGVRETVDGPPTFVDLSLAYMEIPLSNLTGPSPGWFSFRQGENGYSKSRDTYILHALPSTSYDGEPYLSIQSGAYSLIFYNITSIPDIATIAEARLQLTSTSQTSVTAYIHRLINDLATIPGATGGTRDGINPWASGGLFSSADYYATPLSTFIAPSGFSIPFNVTIPADYIQSNLVSNKVRLVILTPEDTQKTFSSNEGPIYSRPKLFIRFTSTS